MSTATSSTAPLAHATYLACPGGTSAKWMPRSTPAAETEQFSCCKSNGWPIAIANASFLNHSRKTPRGSPICFGVISHAPGTLSSRYGTFSLLRRDDSLGTITVRRGTVGSSPSAGGGRHGVDPPLAVAPGEALDLRQATEVKAMRRHDVTELGHPLGERAR